MKGYMYILLCSNGKYYTGSTKNLEKRIEEHNNGEGANFTKKYLPVKLVYYEEYDRIDEAFYREKQVQGWSRIKKEALINGENSKLPELSKNYSQFGNKDASIWDTGTSTSSVPDSVVEPVETTDAKAIETITKKENIK